MPEDLQRSQTADPQHDLLSDARVDVAAVERIGDITVGRVRIFGDVGIEQVQLHPPDVDVPDLDPDGSGRQFDRELHVAAVRSLHRPHRQGVEVVHRIPFELPSVGIQDLLVVSLLVEQSDADEWHVGVA